MRSHPYFIWIPLLLDHLGISEADVRGGRLTPNWLLVPHEGKELTPGDVQGLYRDVRAWLLDGLREQSSQAFLRQRLRKLIGIDTLPLVYAMRLVAVEYANHNRYWPPFLEHLLANQVEYTQFVNNVAPLFTEQWIKLYGFSQNRLYYPREGKANIKWPISHAGLLPENKRLVELFGLELKTETGGQVHPVLDLEVDEFQTEMQQWLFLSGNGSSSLAGLISHRERGLTVSALAQHVLRQRWGLLKEPEETSRTARKRSIRPFFRYNARMERLELVLDELECPGLVKSVHVSFGEDGQSWPVINDPSRHISRGAGNVAFTVKHPIWPNSITLSVDDGEPQKVLIVESPFKSPGGGALMFTAQDGGRRTRAWHPEQSYYLLANSAVANTPWVDALFEDVQRLGTPAGSWNGYSVFLVRSRNLDDRPLSIQDLETLNSMLHQANAALSLPGLAELLTPRLRPVYGLPLPTEGKEPVFATAYPPAFEVRGLWSNPILCLLERWTVATGTFESVTESVILPPTNRPVVVLPFEETEPAVGRYRIRVEDTELPFVLARQARKPVPNYDLTLTCQVDGEDAGLIHPSHHVSTCRFTLQAWPGACVSLCVDTGSKQIFVLTLDENGIREFYLPDFVPHLHRARDVACYGTCGAARSEVHKFMNSPSVVCTATLSGRSLHIEGTVSHSSPVTEARIWVIETDAWQGASTAVQSEIVAVQEGRFRVDIAPVAESARWVVVTSRDLSDSPAWNVGGIDGRVQPVKPWKFGVLEEPWDQWGKLADWLSRFHIMKKDLRRAVVFSQAARLTRAVGVLPLQLNSAVRAIPPGLRHDLPALLSTAAPPVLVLVPPRLELPKRLPTNLDDRNLTDYPGLPLAPEIARALLTQSLPEDGVPIFLESIGPRVESRLYHAPNGRARLVSFGPVRLCGNCGNLLTSATPAAKHTSNPLLAEKCNSFIPADPEVDLALAIVWNPRQLLRSLVVLVEDLLAGKDCPYLTEALYDWISAIPFQVGATSDDFRRVCNLCTTLIEFAALPVADEDDGRMDSFGATLAIHQSVVEHVVHKLIAWAN